MRTLFLPPTYQDSEERRAGWLSAEETRAVLDAMRLPVAPGGVARSAEQAAELARNIGFPVAVKLASHRTLHKTEKGAVHLNVADEAAVRNAFEAIRRGTSRRRLSHRRLAYPGGAPSEGTGCPVHYGFVSGCPERGGRLHPGRE